MSNATQPDACVQSTSDMDHQYGIFGAPPQGVTGFASNGGGAAFGNPALTRQGDQQREWLKQLMEYMRLQQQAPYAPATAAVRG